MKLYWPIPNPALTVPLGLNGSQIYVSQWFGERPAYYAKYGLLGHDGIDIAAPLDTPILAPHDGYVIESIVKDTGYGIRVQLYFEADGFGWITIFGHMHKSAFPETAMDLNLTKFPVKRGDVLGWVDSTGDSSGNHLHFGLRQYKDKQILNYNNGFFGWLDPKPYIQNPYKLELNNMKIIKDNRPNPDLVIVGFGVDNPDNLKWIASQGGLELPLKGDGSVDFNAIKYDGEIN